MNRIDLLIQWLAEKPFEDQVKILDRMVTLALLILFYPIAVVALLWFASQSLQAFENTPASCEEVANEQ